MALRLYLVRHGETRENVAGILQGHLPGHLTERGREQAREAREQLRNVPATAMVCSDLQRCLDTAAIINEAFGLPLQPTELLRERDWGTLTGCPVRQYVERIDEVAESVDDMFARAGQLLNRLAERYDGQTVIAVGHGLFNRVVQAVYYGKSIRDIPRMSNAEVRMLDIVTPLSLQGVTEETGATAD